MKDILPELKLFILDFCKRNKIKNIDLTDLNIETSIDLDLNIFDIDIDLFMTEFVERFKIDYSTFNWNKYGYPKGSTLVGVLRILFGYKRKWVKRIATIIYKPKFFVENLQNAIITGVLS